VQLAVRQLLGARKYSVSFRLVSLTLFLTGALRAAQSAGYLRYSKADFEFFSPRRGDTVQFSTKVPSSVFGMDDGTFLCAKFHPTGATIRV